MRIMTAHIYGYGKLVNKTFNFNEGMNLILGYNETGKSTLMSFIKAMLYGHKKNEREGKDGSIPENRKFKPWDTDKYGGYLIIESDDKRILRVERDFNSKSITVFYEYNEDITNEFSYSKENGMLGQDLLGMDFECFTNSSFMCQDKNLLYPEDKEHIAQKLMNISESGEEDVSVVDALKKLKESVTFLGNERTSKRKYNILISQMNEETRQLKTMKEDNEKCIEYLSEAEDLKKEIKKLETEEKLCARKEIFDSVNKSTREYENLVKKIEEVENELSDVDIDAYKKKRGQFNSDKKEYENYKDLQEIKKVLYEEEKRNSKNITFFIIFGVIVISATAVLSALVDIWFIFTSLAAIPFIVLILLLRKKNLSLNEETKRIEELMEIEKELDQTEERIKNDNLKNDILKKYQEMQKQILEQQDVLDYNALLEKAEVYSLKTVKPLYSREQCIGLIQTKRERLAVVNAQLDRYVKSDVQIASKQELISVIGEQLNSLKDTQKALEYAISGIEEASKQIKEEIIPKMNQKMSEYLYRITANTHNNLLTGSTMDLNTEHNNSIRSAYSFSDGTLRQMYLAFRLAASRVFSSSKVTPIFMDETLVYYDKNRKKSTFDFLYELSKHNQIMFFATDIEEELLYKKDITVITLN